MATRAVPIDTQPMLPPTRWRHPRARPSATPYVRFLGKPAIRQQGEWRTLPRRLAEILLMLCTTEGDLSITGIARRLSPDQPSTNAVKQALSRLRRYLPIKARPYRLDQPIANDVSLLQFALRTGNLRRALGLYAGPLLNTSNSPWVIEQRDAIEAHLRDAFIRCSDTALMLRYLQTVDAEDLELAELTLSLLPAHDRAHAQLASQIAHIRRTWRL